MSTDLELGVWGFENYVLYLCAIIERMCPEPPKGTLAKLINAARAAARDGSAEVAGKVSAPRSQDPTTVVARYLAAVIHDWTLFLNAKDEKELRKRYQSATDSCRLAERFVIGKLGHIGLAECAARSFPELNPNEDQRDAAIAAMMIGHFDVALSLLGRE